MNDVQHESAPTEPAAQDAAPPTQAQLYDDLRRIGQLEDQKLAIQSEIDERTERLRQAIPGLDADSLLYKMLSTSMGKPSVKKKSSTTRRKTKKKTTSKKRR